MTMKTPKRPKPRTRLPRLTPANLTLFMQQLAALPNVSQRGKEDVMQSLMAATNADAESPDVVIESLDAPERERVKAAQVDYGRTLGAMNARGRQGLMGMTDDEFERRLNNGD
jgi:hypothetical protein